MFDRAITEFVTFPKRKSFLWKATMFDKFLTVKLDTSWLNDKTSRNPFTVVTYTQ